MNILIIDNGPDLLERLSSVLTSEHYTIDTAPRWKIGAGKNFERHLRSDTSRYHAASHERTEVHTELRTAGILMLTTRVNIDNKVARLNLGADDYLAKPLLVLANKLREMVTGVGIGIVAALMLIFLLSYLLATRLLRPLSTINHNIKEIRDNSLSRRILLGTSRDELYVLSGSLNSMFDRLQYSSARQKEFISNAAHELKSPLTILMLGHEEMLAARPPEEIYRELEKQLNSMRRLSRLIRNLLDISRLEQEEICLSEPVKLEELIGQVLENFKELLNARNIRVQTDLSEITLLADPEKILRLIINLIDNAIKYNYAEDGMILVTTEKVQDQAVVVIANTSQDIPVEDLPRIFDQFYRVEKSRSQSFGGPGLGLTIAQKIVELHDGAIMAKSHRTKRQGKGLIENCNIQFNRRKEWQVQEAQPRRG